MIIDYTKPQKFQNVLCGSDSLSFLLEVGARCVPGRSDPRPAFFVIPAI